MNADTSTAYKERSCCFEYRVITLQDDPLAQSIFQVSEQKFLFGKSTPGTSQVYHSNCFFLHKEITFRSVQCDMKFSQAFIERYKMNTSITEYITVI